MKVLFLTMVSSVESVETSGIYTDLIRKFRDEGHNVYVIFPRERRAKQHTQIKCINNVHLLGVRTLNLTKTNVLEKGVGQLLLEMQFNHALRQFWKDVTFDLILYSTPPITFTKVIKTAKRNNPNAVSYLLLKDIFPQNAVDMGMLSKNGVKGLLYKFFRSKEKKLYALSDYIGCMSPANVKYVLEHNPEIDPEIVEMAPNSYDSTLTDNILTYRGLVRGKYGLPLDKPIFIYGGNMGKPQGIPFLLECLKSLKDRSDCHFVIVGDGTEYPKLDAWVKSESPKSVSLFQHLPKEDYDRLADACDVGLIFLDWRFTIPNYPSRLLPYLMKKKPIIAATDSACDIGTIAEENGYGFWCPSNSVESFVKSIDRMLLSDLDEMGEKGYQFYLNNYTVKHTYNAIMQHLL